jgi:hypothetical protein
MRGKPYGNRLRIKDPNGIETRFVAENLVEFTRKEKRQIAKFIKRCLECRQANKLILNSRLRKKNMEARNALA